MTRSEHQTMDIAKIRRIHFTGIKGVAMTALALYVKQLGKKVSGSDIAEVFPTDEILSKNGIYPTVGFDTDLFDKKLLPDLVIYTGAHGGYDNPQVIAARAHGIPSLAHGVALGLFMGQDRQISVAGSHGKTTTSAMIATILSKSGVDPSYAIGCGDIFGLGMPGHKGKGNIFVAEADEYVTDPTHDRTPRFLWQYPEVLVVTNIDYDHPDAYGSLREVQDAFLALQSRQTGQKTTIVNYDDAASRVLTASKINSIVTYGLSPDAQYRISHIGFGEKRTFFTLTERGMEIGEFSLCVPGKHNAINAAAAVLACRAVGVSWDRIREGLVVFGGTKRRCEMLGTVGAITYFDDYAHHPAEILATLDAIRQWYPNRRIITVFQPHTYSRTKALLQEFGRSFSGSTIVLITDIYSSAREKDTLGITGASLVEEISKSHNHVFYTKDKDSLFLQLQRMTSAGDIVIFMGAGNIYGWAHEFMDIIGGKE